VPPFDSKNYSPFAVTYMKDSPWHAERKRDIEVSRVFEESVNMACLFQILISSSSSPTNGGDDLSGGRGGGFPYKEYKILKKNSVILKNGE
jgi:hypothetical protein